MKNVFLAILICFTYQGYAQNILAQSNENANFIYCELVGQARWLSKKINVEIDFGQGMYGDQRIRDEETGKVKRFISMVDALNYMGERGWEFVQAYAFTHDNTTVFYYILKRPKSGTGYIPDTK